MKRGERSISSSRSRRAQIAANLQTRQRVTAALRKTLAHDGFLEVETPVRIPAPAPEPFIEPFESEGWYLQTSPELCMKRLLASGYDRIFTICRVFRKGERGRLHLPEFTMLEWYAAGWDHQDLMHHVQNLVSAVCLMVSGSHLIEYQGIEIDFAPPWPQIRLDDAFERFCKKSMDQALCSGDFDEAMAFLVEPGIAREYAGTPVFLTGFPAQRSPLARRDPSNPSQALRFELFAGGMELANGFFEQNDPEKQKQAFVCELERRKKTGQAVLPMPGEFLSDLPAMPEAAGCALGVDRLVMLFCDAYSIDQVSAFVCEEL